MVQDRDSTDDGPSDGSPEPEERPLEGLEGAPTDYNLDDVYKQLQLLEATVTSDEERREVRRARKMLKRVPGSDRISKYTTRDMGESFVGGIVFSLPLLVEDGVFEIAEWFAEHTIANIPVFLALNVLFVITLTAGLLYAVDFREVKITNPLFGFIPRRLVGVLAISFIVAAGTMFMWGRLHEEDPSTVEQFNRITVIWAAAALGAVLADILPGESKGEDLSEILGSETGETDTESSAIEKNNESKTGENNNESKANKKDNKIE